MILRNVAARLQTCSYQALRYCTAVVNEQASSEEVAPIISKKSYADEKFFYQKPREVWLESLDTVESKKVGLVTLHPDVYGASPRIDIIHQNVRWQRLYRFVVISIYYIYLFIALSRACLCSKYRRHAVYKLYNFRITSYEFT